MSEVYDSDIAHSQRFNLQWVNKRIKDYRYREKEWSVGRGDLGIKKSSVGCKTPFLFKSD